MSVGFIGAGQLACALARGFTAAGERVASLPSPGSELASERVGGRGANVNGRMVDSRPSCWSIASEAGTARAAVGFH